MSGATIQAGQLQAARLKISSRLPRSTPSVSFCKAELSALTSHGSRAPQRTWRNTISMPASSPLPRHAGRIPKAMQTDIFLLTTKPRLLSPTRLKPSHTRTVPRSEPSRAHGVSMSRRATTARVQEHARADRRPTAAHSTQCQLIENVFTSR